MMAEEKAEFSLMEAVLPYGDSPNAFHEVPAVCLAYMQAVHTNIFGNETEEASIQHLHDSLDLLELSGTLPKCPAPATALATAK